MKALRVTNSDRRHTNHSHVTYAMPERSDSLFILHPSTSTIAQHLGGRAGLYKNQSRATPTCRLLLGWPELALQPEEHSPLLKQTNQPRYYRNIILDMH